MIGPERQLAYSDSQKGRWHLEVTVQVPGFPQAPVRIYVDQKLLKESAEFRRRVKFILDRELVNRIAREVVT